MILNPRVNRINVSRDGLDVVINFENTTISMPWKSALELHRAIKIMATQIETEMKAEKIALDQAILIRKGIPVGLTNDKHVLKEAGKEAAWNSDLRRYMPGGIQSQSVVGKPSLIMHPKWRGNNGNNRD